MPKDEMENEIRIWEKIIEVQQHFNDVKSKNQTLFISIITASLAATGYLFNTGSGSSGLIHFYSFPILGAVIFTIAFFVLDYGVYHTLLKGAVECGKKFERKHLKRSLTSTVIEEFSEKSVTLGFRGSGAKLVAFYVIIGGSLLLSFLIMNLDLWIEFYNKIQNCL